ncbi:MAG: glycosyltransferase [Candidatus Promineifilaceae bacterium]
MPQINIIALGSRGDVQPHVVQAAALLQAGYNVRLLAPHGFADFAAQYDIPFAPLQGDVQEMLQSAEGKALLKTRNPLTMAAKMRDLAQPILRKGTLDAIEACRECRSVVDGRNGRLDRFERN